MISVIYTYFGKGHTWHERFSGPLAQQAASEWKRIFSNFADINYSGPTADAPAELVAIACTAHAVHN